MKDDVFATGFLREWETAWQGFLENPAKAERRNPTEAERRNELWEGRLAFDELATTGRIDRVLPGEGTPMLDLLLRHLRCFRRLVWDALPQAEAYAEDVKAFRKASKVLQKADKNGPLQAELRERERLMRTEAWVREEDQKDYWRLRLLPYDRSGWEPKIWFLGDTKWTSRYPHPPHIVERADEIFNRVSLPKRCTSLRDLHTWLQLRAAIVFKLFLSLPELTTFTTARLVMLLYVCAHFGEPNPLGDGLILGGTSLGLRSLDEKLRRYGVDKVSFSNQPIPEVLATGITPPTATVAVLWCKDFQDVVDEIASKMGTGQSVVPATCVHLADEFTIERFSDSTVSVVFSPEYTERQKEMKSEGYKMVGLFDGRGLICMPFNTDAECRAAKDVAMLAISEIEKPLREKLSSGPAPYGAK